MEGAGPVRNYRKKIKKYDVGSKVRISSPAKLNLFLEVLGKRPDGYHTISTIFERVSLADEIIIKQLDESCIKINSDSKDIPEDSRNLAYKAASLLREDLGIRKGVTIRIKKRIPVGAGLGGGSSNAASTLLGLNRLWNLRLSRKKLLEYGSKIGSDVAFFLYNSAFARGSLRGERISPLKNIKRKFWHIVIVPDISVSTKGIYRELDRLGRNSLNVDKRRCRAFGAGSRGLEIDKILFNSLEEITFKKYPKVKELKESLIAHGVKNVLMSGSGSAVFGIVNSRKEGLEAAKFFKPCKDLRVFVVRTL